MTTTHTCNHLETGALECAVGQFDQAAERLNLDPGMRDLLANPKRELSVTFPVKMDDGSLQVFQGYRVHHNETRGPVKGGLAIAWPSISTRYARSRCG